MIGVGVFLLVIGVAVPLCARAELWRACLPAAVGRREVVGWTALGFALNQAVGFRSGDAARIALARERCGLGAAAASVALFRAVELTALFAIAAIAAASLGLGAGMCSLVAGGLALALALAPRVARRIGSRGWIAPLARLDGRGLARASAIALATYLAEAALFVGAAYALGVPLGWGQAVFLVAASTLGQVAAVLPANLGTYEASVAAALAAFGVEGAALWQLPVLTHAVRVAFAASMLPLFLTRTRRVTT